MYTKMIGEAARRLRESRGWSVGRLVSEIIDRYGEPVSPKTIKALESEGHGTLRLVTLVFASFWNVPKEQLVSYFQDMLRQINHDQPLHHCQSLHSSALGASPES